MDDRFGSGGGGSASDGAGRADDTRIDDRLTDAIDLVSHETRVAALIALADHQREAPRDPALRFSELRRRVGHDDPGNFNYHLDRLQDGLVEKTDAGYRLSDVGHHFVAVVLSGKLDPDRELELADVETACPLCESTASVSYADGLLRVECGADHSLRLNVGPDVVTDYPAEAALNLALHKSLFESRLSIEGVCPYCEGPTSGSLEPTGREDVPVIYEAPCERCGAFHQNTPGGCVLEHPAVISLCHDHGLDVRADAWTILTDHVGTAELLAEDPPHAAVEVSIGGDALVLELDETAEVVHVDDPDGT